MEARFDQSRNAAACIANRRRFRHPRAISEWAVRPFFYDGDAHYRPYERGDDPAQTYPCQRARRQT